MVFLEFDKLPFYCIYCDEKISNDGAQYHWDNECKERDK